MRIHHPPTEQNAPRAYIQNIYTDGTSNTLVSHRDENGNITTYDRDNRDGTNPYHRVCQIHYPDGSSEQFLNFNQFGQAQTHVLKSGGVETFTFDGRGLKTSYTPPPTDSDPNPGAHATYYFYYGGGSGTKTDRPLYVQDPRGNATWYDYNARGQVTRLTHQDGSYTQSCYNPDGTLAWVADENHPGAEWDENQRTRYTYDEYKRLRTITNPLNQTTTYVYAQDDWQNPLLVTDANPKAEFSPMSKQIHYAYDANRRRTISRQAPGTSDDAMTFFAYDEVGNQTAVQDPRGNVTTFGYDARNRRISKTDPAPFNNQVTQWQYDGVGNRTRETRPDGSFRSWDYDEMNRVRHAYDWRTNENPTPSQTVTYTYGNAARDLTSITDQKNATYSYGYDMLQRKIIATYPQDATGVQRSETWHFDPAGNMDRYSNPDGKYKHLEYDCRNRQRHTYWNSQPATTIAQSDCSANTIATYPDWSVGPEVRTEIDVANRVTSITTNGGETSLSYGYDNANRKTDETQAVAGYTPHTLHTIYDADGNRDTVKGDGGAIYAAHYTYTGRNQILTLCDANTGAQWFGFAYDAAGNLAQRQSWTAYQNYSYDQLNRVQMHESGWAGQAAFTRTRYTYDSVGREITEARDEWDPKGDRFSYDVLGQLTRAVYDANNYWTTAPINASKDVSYNVDALNRTGSNGVNENGMLTAYTPNALNQYAAVGSYGMGYDNNFNISSMGGGTLAYDAENRATNVAVSGVTMASFVYDGLGRCLKRTLGGVTRLLVYDDWSPIVKFDGSNNFVNWNVYGPLGPDDIILSAYGDGTLSVYQKDRRGSVTHVSGWGADLREWYRYDAFGYPSVNGTAQSTSNIGNRFMWTGREWLSAINAYDFRHRVYQPMIGRFIQKDPTGFAAGDMNLFRYCGGDPVNHTDPTGLITDWQREKAFFGDSTESYADQMDNMAPRRAEPAGNEPTQISSKGAQEGAVTRDPDAFRSQFYSERGDEFDRTLRQVSGEDAKYIPRQTMENAPELVTHLSVAQLAQKTRKDGQPVTGTIDSHHGRFGTIYIAKERWISARQERVFRTYAHELANLVSERHLPCHNPYAHGDPVPNDVSARRWDRDVGAAVSRRMFYVPTGEEW